MKAVIFLNGEYDYKDNFFKIFRLSVCNILYLIDC